MSLTEAEERTVARYRKMLAEDSPLMVAYNQKLAAYESAVLEYNARRVDALAADNTKAVHYWALNANILRNKVRAAKADLVATGRKDEVEMMRAYINHVTGDLHQQNNTISGGDEPLGGRPS